MTATQDPSTASPDCRPVLRFAPSPNGELHLGHALSALTGFEMARRLGGRFLVRIEDIDPGRSRPELIDGIFRDLAWLGIDWEEPVRRQSEHIADYIAAARTLESVGVLYPCFASRAEIQAAALPGVVDPDGAALYPGVHRGISQGDVDARRQRGEPFAMRLDMARALGMLHERLGASALEFIELDAALQPHAVVADPARWGDVVIQRKDVATSYHLAVVVDDARQGVTHVTRGQDLFAATDLHRLLQELLGLSAPIYHHHRLITDSRGRKLSKSQRDTSLKVLRLQRTTPVEVRRLVGLDS